MDESLSSEFLERIFSHGATSEYSNTSNRTFGSGRGDESSRDNSMELGGYYFPDEEKIQQAMRPSDTFNQALSSL